MPSEYRVHSRVPFDINEAELFYLGESGVKLADRFLNELFAAFEHAAEHPTLAHYDVMSRSRRKNLENFPYHFLYENHSKYIYIFVVRHNKRRPGFGLARKR